MREFRIRLREAAFDGLVDRALKERRAPAEQASYMLERSLLRSKAAPRAPQSAPPNQAALSGSEPADGR